MTGLAWGTYNNGAIPLSAMTPVANFKPVESGANTAIGSNLLMPEAARQLSLWQIAYKARFGVDLNCSECYRPLVRQTALYGLYQSGGTLAAVPGTSNHGFGRAVDFGYPVDTFGTAQRNWMGDTAASYGFRFDVPTEAWHASYYGNPTITTASTGTATVITPTTAEQEEPMAILLKYPAGQAAILPGIGYVAMSPADVSAFKATSGPAVQVLNCTNAFAARAQIQSAIDHDTRLVLYVPPVAGKGGGYALLEARKVSTIGSMDTVNTLQAAGAPTITLTAAQLAHVEADYSR